MGTDIMEYKKVEPDRETIHNFCFTKDEVRNILIKHISKTITFPKGRVFLYGNNSSESRGDTITLRVTEKEEK